MLEAGKAIRNSKLVKVLDGRGLKFLSVADLRVLIAVYNSPDKAIDARRMPNVLLREVLEAKVRGRH